MASKKNHKRELLVAGYVRNVETIHKIKSVPIEINDIIYLYQRLLDVWNKKYSNEGVVIDESTGIMSVNSEEDVTAYGSIIVSKDVFKWRIKLVSVGENDIVTPSFIGIIENEEALLMRYQDRFHWDRNGCQLCGGSGSLYSSMPGILKPLHGNYQCRWKKQDDILEMTLDLNEHTLSYKVNDTDFGVAFKNIRQNEYRLAWSTFDAKGAIFMLMD